MNRFTFSSAIGFLLVFNLLACKQVLYPAVQPGPAISVNRDSPSDSSYVADIQPYKTKLDGLMGKVIGHSAQDLPADRLAKESGLGNFVADLMRKHAAQLSGQPVDLALVNNGSLRVSINKGAVTLGNIYELMPFDNELMLVRLKGEQMQELFNYIVNNQKTGFSNMALRFKDKQLVSATIGGQPFDPQKTYTVAVYDYIANGGDNMSFMQSLPKEPTGTAIRTLIIREIEELTQQGKQIEAHVEERVRFE